MRPKKEEGNVTRSKTIRITLATLVAAIAVAPIALASGEPKNELPFTRSVTEAAMPHPSTALASGDSKNQTPFTRPVSPTTTIVVRGVSDGFDWNAAAIGAAGALGAALAAAGAVTIARTSRRPNERAAA
jgi:hypothetical protein